MNKMNKEFVPYEQALELKELGFNESCFGEYRQCAGRNPYLEFYQDDSPESTSSILSFTTECSAPTFSQAFRWFREKYNIHAYISCRTKDDGDTVYIPHGRTIPDTVDKNGFIIDIIIYSIKNTYEEAELICLIKLIEIVKNK